MKKLILATLMAAAFGSAAAQQTGSFDIQIPFMGEQRTLAYYVPDDYDASADYNLLVSLHGLGDNATNLRNALIGSDWQSTIPNTIMVFVDGGDNDNGTRDHLSPEGEEGLVYDAIDSTLANYSIDSEEIILHGFSYGGRSALKIGLDDPDYFKGLYLSTPAIQGYNDLQNDTVGPLNTSYNYSNASRIPIFMTVGVEDISYLNQVRGLYLELIKNDGIAAAGTLNGGHSIGGGAINTAMLGFIDNPYSEGVNLGIAEKFGPEKYLCNNESAGQVLVRNTGTDAVTSIVTETQFDDTSISPKVDTFNLSSPIGSFQSRYLDIQIGELDENVTELEGKFSILMVNGATVDPTIPSNSSEMDLLYNSVGSTEKRVDEMNGQGDMDWEREPNYFPFEFIEESNAGRDMLLAFNHPFLFHHLGYSHTMYSPFVNVDGLEKKELTLDYAFSFVNFDLQGGGTVDISDTLVIKYSTNCGDSWETLYKQGGEELATYGPIKNPNSIQALLTYPLEPDYGTLKLDLSGISGDKVQFRLDYLSGTGGVIWLDRITIGDDAGAVTEIEGLNLYPNPASDNITLDYGKGQLSELSVVDATGRTIATTTNISSQINLSLEGYTNGSYTVVGRADGQRFAIPFIKR